MFIVYFIQNIVLAKKNMVFQVDPTLQLMLVRNTSTEVVGPKKRMKNSRG